MLGTARTMLLAPDGMASMQAAAATWVIAVPFELAATATSRTTGAVIGSTFSRTPQASSARKPVIPFPNAA